MATPAALEMQQASRQQSGGDVINRPFPGPSSSLVEILDMSLQKDQQQGKDGFYPLRPSSAGACARKLAYDLCHYKGYKTYSQEVREGNVVRLLSLGSGIEYNVFRHFELCKESFKVGYKQQVVTLFKLDPVPGVAEEQRLIEGSIDAVFYSPEWKLIVDIKSAKDKFHAAYKTQWDDTLAKYDGMASLTKISENGWWCEDLEAFLNETHDVFLNDNFIQLNSYLFSDFALARGIQAGSIIKYCKNDSRMYEIRFRANQNLFDYVEAKFNAVNAIVETDKAPDGVNREYIFGSIRCAFCPYKTHCYPGGDALTAYFGTLPSKEWPIDSDKFADGGRFIEAAFATFMEIEEKEEGKEALESEIIKAMAAEKVRKIKLQDGRIYFLKNLKDGLVIRRGKL